MGAKALRAYDQYYETPDCPKNARQCDAIERVACENLKDVKIKPVNYSFVFTWRRGGHIGVLKQKNGGHIGEPNQSSGSLNLFLCENRLFACPVGENTLYDN